MIVNASPFLDNYPEKTVRRCFARAYVADWLASTATSFAVIIHLRQPRTLNNQFYCRLYCFHGNHLLA